MAAIDPSARTGDSKAPPRATLKMVYNPSGPGDEEDSEGSDDEDSYLRALQNGIESDGLSDEDEDDEDDDTSDDEKNGGPSDPAKSTKARKEAAAKEIIRSLIEQSAEEDSDEDMDDASPKLNGVMKGSKTQHGKGKGKATAETLDDEQINGDVEMEGLEEVVICTLDPTKTYQQPLDITIPEDQPTFFKVSGTHTVYLTGNYVIPSEDRAPGGLMDEDEYDLSPDEDELEIGEDESDELDSIDDPRITEVDTDDEEHAPPLIETIAAKQESKQKGKNKRPAADSDEDAMNGATLDDIISKSLKPEESSTNQEAKLSKKQKKKLKNNAGAAVEASTDGVAEKQAKAQDHTAKTDKKVSFAKELEQGPSSSQSAGKAEPNGAMKNQATKQSTSPKTPGGIKVVQGVKIDDRKMGQGPTAKKGDKLGMRYIGKLSDGRVFDANKKGPPFRFRLGSGEVIKGWDVGLSGMSVNGERRIIIPANLGYGSKKQGTIPPNSELTFDVKLLEIN